MMENEFIPYEEALALKELGFEDLTMAHFANGEFSMGLTSNLDKRTYESVSSPLYQQVFEWFREEFGLYHTIIPEFYTGGINFNWQLRWYLPKEKWTEYVISDGTYWYGDNGEFPTQRDAELGCLQKLIELANGKESNK